MQGYAVLFLICAGCAALFIDSNVDRNVARIGKVALAAFGALFVVTEAIALLS